MSGTYSCAFKPLERDLNPVNNQQLIKLVRKTSIYDVFFAMAPNKGVARAGMSKNSLVVQLQDLEQQGVYPLWSIQERTITWIDTTGKLHTWPPNKVLFIYPSREMLAITIEDTVVPGRPLEMIKEEQLELI